VVEAAREPIPVLIGIIDRIDAKEMAIEAPQLTL
jgi:hypothetical protein